MATEENGLTPAQDIRLDQLLAQWRQRHQLSVAVADQVRQSIIATEALPEDWWSHFNHTMNHVWSNAGQWQGQLPEFYGGGGSPTPTRWQFVAYQQSYLRPTAM